MSLTADLPTPSNAPQSNRLIDEIAVGDRAELQRRLSTDDLHLFRLLTADAADSLAGGMWGGTLVAGLVGTQLPGPGSSVLAQRLQYHYPVRAGDVLTLRAEVTQRQVETRRLQLRCECVNQDGTVVFDGEADVSAPETRVAGGTVAPATAAKSEAEAGALIWVDRARALGRIRVAVVHPCDALSLSSSLEARRLGLIEPVLVGPEARIRAVAEEQNLDLTGLQIESVPHSHAAATRAVALAAAGDVQAIMKGSLHTDEVMAAVVSRDGGLRTKRRVSHCFVIHTPGYPRHFLVTDAAINIRPTLPEKVDIIQNAITLAQVLGVATPRVAILSAVETVTPAIPSTLDAAALCKMADRGQITGGVLDGPLAFDNAVSPAAARVKGIVSPVAGQADILVTPDLESGNMVAKQLEYMAQASSAGIVLGARVPVILTSRADPAANRLASCAVAVLLAHHFASNPP